MPIKTLVTGGAGFIGSHLVDRLIDRGDTVFVVDDLSTGRLDNLERVRQHPKLHLVVDSVLNWPMMDDVVGQVDQVVHLAAAVGVKKIMDVPVETITTNVRGTEIVLDLCHRHGKRVYVASTSEIYGKAGERLHEDHDRIMGSVKHRRWAYACTKVLDEFLALAYHQEKGLDVIIGRFFNTVGPRQTGQWGMVVPTFVGQALRHEPITVYGSGEQRRCFLHVHDAVEAVVGLLDEPRAIGQIFNIGHETEITIRGLAERIRDALDSASQIVTIPYLEAYGDGFEDMERRQPDTGRIHDLIGWTPTRDLAQVIEETASALAPV